LLQDFVLRNDNVKKFYDRILEIMGYVNGINFRKLIGGFKNEEPCGKTAGNIEILKVKANY
jgi:hypothetical protein